MNICIIAYILSTVIYFNNLVSCNKMFVTYEIYFNNNRNQLLQNGSYRHNPHRKSEYLKFVSMPYFQLNLN